MPVEEKSTQNMKMGKIVCIVPGCGSCRKKLKSEGGRYISMFLPPRDPDLFEKWRQAIARCDFDLKQKDPVCELHFLEGEIERYYVTILRDGTINKIEKGRVTLKTGAVPSIFPDLLGNEMLRRKHAMIKNPVVETPKDKLSPIDNLKDRVTDRNFSYEQLLRTVMFLKKPNNFWSVTATVNFIILARWNEDLMPEKRVVIGKNLNARVFLRENEIEGTDLLEITNDDDIIDLLQKVENYKFYAGASDNVC